MIKNNQIAGFGAKVDRLVNQVKRAVALDIFGTLISPPPDGTPIEFAFASGGWNYGVNRVITDVPQQVSKGARVPPPTPQDIGIDVSIGDEINISNNVPYIGALNDGHSDQSPAGFIEDAVDGATANYKKLVDLVKNGNLTER